MTKGKKTGAIVYNFRHIFESMSSRDSRRGPARKVLVTKKITLGAFPQDHGDGHDNLEPKRIGSSGNPRKNVSRKIIRVQRDRLREIPKPDLPLLHTEPRGVKPNRNTARGTKKARNTRHNVEEGVVGNSFLNSTVAARDAAEKDGPSPSRCTALSKELATDEGGCTLKEPTQGSVDKEAPRTVSSSGALRIAGLIERFRTAPPRKREDRKPASLGESVVKLAGQSSDSEVGSPARVKRGGISGNDGDASPPPPAPSAAALPSPPPTPTFRKKRLQRQERKWYYIDTVQGDVQCGAYSTKQMLNLIDENCNCVEATPVWCHGLPDWIQMCEVPFFQSRFAANKVVLDSESDLSGCVEEGSSWVETSSIVDAVDPVESSPRTPASFQQPVASPGPVASPSPATKRRRSDESDAIRDIVRGIEAFVKDDNREISPNKFTAVACGPIASVRDEIVQTEWVETVSVTCSTAEQGLAVENHAKAAPKVLDAASQVSADTEDNWYEDHVQGVLNKMSNSPSSSPRQPEAVPKRASSLSAAAPSSPTPIVETNTATDESQYSRDKSDEVERSSVVPVVPHAMMHRDCPNPVVNSLEALQSLISRVKVEKQNIARKKVNMPAILGDGYVVRVGGGLMPVAPVVENIPPASPQLPSLLRDLIDTVEREKRRISNLRL